MILCSLWHSLKKESKILIRIGSKKIAWFYKVVSTPWALNWYNSWDISVAATAQLTYYQQGLMRLLCFRAGHPALLHPAVITQWLQNATADGKTQSSRNSNCMLHQHMMCSDSQTNAGSANALSPLFGRTGIAWVQETSSAYRRTPAGFLVIYKWNHRKLHLMQWGMHYQMEEQSEATCTNKLQ